MSVLWPDGRDTEDPPYVTSEFNPRRKNPVTGIVQPHNGIDLIGFDTIYAGADGVVTFAGYNGTAGYEVRIRYDHDGCVTRDLHNERLFVRKGQRVLKKDRIALMGSTGQSTGPHNHHETRPGGGAAVNPRQYHGAHNRQEVPASVPARPKPVVPPKRKRKNMSTGVIYTEGASDQNRKGAVVNFESGTFSPFGWFSPGYANGVAVGFGLEKAAPVTAGHYEQIKRSIAEQVQRSGKIFVDIADEDVPQIKA